ncbi:MBL fold metallo-hydrolase [Micromonospora sp. B11E3]|uniref:MBL fold metallo-hydrolase n=1 Tax=Micromonospora sp. B11E3 TaxID=3153562 RepID=UPI00325C720C
MTSRSRHVAAAAVTVAGATGTAAPANAKPGRTTGQRTWDARSVGAYEVIPLLDAAGTFFLDRQAAFPAATPEDWDLARTVDPDAFGPGEAWQLAFRCYAVRGPRHRLTLVDTGVGPDGSPAGGWAPPPGRLPVELDRAGIDPADVDTVVLTHLHEDHFGWSVGLDGTRVFPNARYVVQRREVANLPDGDAARTYVVEPLRGHRATARGGRGQPAARRSGARRLRPGRPHPGAHPRSPVGRRRRRSRPGDRHR